MNPKPFSISIQAAALVLFVCTADAGASTPSFLCSKARTWVERTLCADDHLAQMDLDMAQTFARALRVPDPSRREAIASDQRRWWASRSTCRDATAPAECLAKAYSERMEALRAAADYPGDGPMLAPRIIQESPIKTRGQGWSRELSQYRRAIDRCRKAVTPAPSLVLTAWADPQDASITMWMQAADGGNTLCQADRKGESALLVRAQEAGETMPSGGVALHLDAGPAPAAACNPVEVLDQEGSRYGWLVQGTCAQVGESADRQPAARE